MGYLDNRDWSIVGFDQNPVPGDPSEIETMAKHYSTMGTNFQNMADALDNLTKQDGMDGDWAKKLGEKTVKLPQDFRDFSRGFDTVGKQLDSWSRSVADYQKKASTELDAAENAHATLIANQSNASSEQRNVNQATAAISNLDDTATPAQQAAATRRRNEAQDMLDAYNKHVQSAQHEIDNAKNRVITIHNDYDADGRQCARQISVTALNTTPGLSPWERIHYSNTWNVIVTVLEVASIVLAIATIFVGGWLLIAAAAVAFMQLFMSAGDFIFGDISLQEFGFAALFDVIAIVPGFRAFSKSAKLAGRLGKASRALIRNTPNSTASKLAARYTKEYLVKFLKSSVTPSKFSQGLAKAWGKTGALSKADKITSAAAARRVLMDALKEVGKQSTPAKLFSDGKRFADVLHAAKSTLGNKISAGWDVAADGAKVLKPIFNVPGYEGEPHFPPKTQDVFKAVVPFYSPVTDGLKLPEKWIEIGKLSKAS